MLFVSIRSCLCCGEGNPVAEVRAEMTANVWKVLVKAGDTVADGDTLVIRHVYIERRMIPLNIYLHSATKDQIARAVVEAHDGQIWAASAGLRQGATFSFTLPIARPVSA